MSWFNRRQSVVLGIDISTVAIKLLELSRSGTRYRVDSYAVAPLPQDAITEKNRENIEVIANTIKVAVEQSGTKTKNACVAVAASSVVTKVISMPALLTENEMEEQILVEVDQSVAYALDAVSFDFEVQQKTENNPDKVDVLLVASRRENIEDRIEVLEKAGLKAKIVDIEAFAMENAFLLLADQLSVAMKDQTIAIVDMGATMTTLHVVHQCRTVYTKEQRLGGKQLTEEIQRRYDLSYEQAGLAKKRGRVPDNDISDLVDPFKEAMVRQITRSLQFFSSSSANRKVDAIVLAGGCSSMPGFKNLVEQNFNIPAFVSNPFINMELSNKVKPQNLTNDAPAMMIACGLALRSFD